MTQYGKHKNKSDAGWAVSNKAGKTAKPAKGDFGIDGKLKGNWLCEGGSVRHNGKYWVSALTYVFSGNGKNWDRRYISRCLRRVNQDETIEPRSINSRALQLCKAA